MKELRHENGKYIFRFWDWKWETDINSPDYGKKQFLSENEYKYLVRSAYSIRDVSSDMYLLADSTDVTGNGYLGRYFPRLSFRERTTAFTQTAPRRSAFRCRTIIT